MTQSLTALPHVLFRRSRTFYLQYDLSWLIALSFALAIMQATGFHGIAPTWQWYFPLLFPFVAYADILCQVFIHNACHVNFPRPVNRVVGEILGLIVLARFASWEIIHARHHKYSDDVELDPHPLHRSYWWYLLRSLVGVERQLQRMYLERHGPTLQNRRRERMRSLISFGTNIVLVGVWWKLLGNVGMFFFFIPASVIGWLFVMHFNWVTHNALAKDEEFKPINIDEGVYWLGNRLFFGIYMHANHHRNAGVFNPLRMHS